MYIELIRKLCSRNRVCNKLYARSKEMPVICGYKPLLDEVEHDIMNYQNRGLCYLPKPNTDKRF